MKNLESQIVRVESDLGAVCREPFLQQFSKPGIVIIDLLTRSSWEDFPRNCKSQHFLKPAKF